MTQLESARKGIVTAEIAAVANKEGLDAEIVRQRVAEGLIVIPANINHRHLDHCGIGKGLRTKVNANIGTSPDFGNLKTELEKLKICESARADTVMDLSIGSEIASTRRAIVAATSLAVGTVPMYQATTESIDKWGAIVSLPADHLFKVIEEQAVDGVDFMTVHCGVNQKTLDRLKKTKRITDIVSRGGAFTVGWMLHNEKDNPLYEQYDRLLEIARKYDVTLSLGDGLRPGCLADASDRAQIEELLTIGELVDRARAAGVQVMVEGPGHMPLDQITANVQLEKSVCKGAPFYVLGPLVTDIGAGYDHITAAIGGAIAAGAGADYLCYVTPSEHLALPNPEDVHQGIIASRIAAHAGDIIKGVKGAMDWDMEMASARKSLDWQKQASLSIDPAHAYKVHSQHSSTAAGCSMCGKYCAMEMVSNYLGGKTVERC